MLPTSPPVKSWTVLSIIEHTSSVLKEHGFDEARLNTELLLGHVLRLKRIELYTNHDKPLSHSELDAFRAVLTRRLTHEPLQYIVGETNFMGFPLFLDRSVLIPRPETEELVEHAVNWIRGIAPRTVSVLDIGTGSGNIPIAIEQLAPNAILTSVDVSTDALALAARNIERNGCSRITLKHMDIFEDALEESSFDAIVSNPPYISLEEHATLEPEVRQFEPTIATTDGDDGYRFVRRICTMASRVLRENGPLFLEVGHSQGNQARRIAIEAGLTSVDVIPDFAGTPRIVHGRRAA
jgi:release factor glutamine methyltransferase